MPDDPLKYWCARCGAAPGAACVSRGPATRDMPIDPHFHLPRRHAAGWEIDTGNPAGTAGTQAEKEKGPPA